jgi:hypothetical protein
MHKVPLAKIYFMALLSFNKRQQRLMTILMAVIGLLSITYIVIIVNAIIKQCYLQS